MVYIKHRWTDSENEYILNNYKKKSKEDFSKIFGTSIAAINHKYRRLGITEKSIMGQSYEWSEKEIQYLKDNWLYKQDKEIWKELGIDKTGFSQYVIQRKRSQLGLVGKSKRIRSDATGYKYYIDYDKRIYTHRTKIENLIGRKLQSYEIVHHIDGDKTNDDISNLFLCKNNSIHMNLHDQLEKISCELVKNGTIKFNKETGNYYL